MGQAIDGASLESLFERARPLSPTSELGRRLQLAIVKASVLADESLAPRCGEYRLEQRVGAGGMGVVFRGRAADGSNVAVKVLARSAPLARARFEQEADALRQIVHPRVVRYLAHGETDEVSYLVMEWLEGRDLARRLAEGPLDPRVALELSLELSLALAAVHAAGLLHRDLKPSNVFLVGEALDDVRLIDFGIAKRGAGHQPKAGLTATGAILGSPHYMAPEQLRGEHEPYSDVYGLGATMFEMLTGRPPFVGAHLGAVLVAVGAEPPPALTALRPELSGPIDSLVRRMLAKDPRERPRDMQAVVAELSDLLSRRHIDGVVSHLERPFLRRRAKAERALLVPSRSRPLGRAREFHLLRGVIEAAFEADSTAAISVHGETGIGKSHLLLALATGAADWCKALGSQLKVISASASEAEHGTPLSALRALVRADLPRVCSPETARARTHLLASIEEQSEVGAREPRVLADQLQLAWLDLCEAWLEEGPTMIVLDDAHSGDPTSLRYLARVHRLATEAAANPRLHGTQSTAPAASPSQPSSQLGSALVLLYASQEDTSVQESMTDPAAEQSTLLRLGMAPLELHSSMRLAGSLLNGDAPNVAADIAVLAGGNAAHLQELCREVQDGRTRSVVSLSERVWDRISTLDPEARRVLRAASIVGRVSWRGVVAALVADLSDAEFERALGRLLTEGFVSRVATSRIDGEQEFELMSDIVQRVGYGLSTEEQLRAGHAMVARQLAAANAVPPALVGEHLALAGEARSAVEYFVRAARAALVGEDPKSFEYFCERATRAAEEPSQLLELAELRGSHDFWRGELESAKLRLSEALERAEPGTSNAFRLASLVITVLGQRGDNDGVAKLANEVLATPASDGSAESARLIALCRALSQLGVSGHDVSSLRAALPAELDRSLDPEARVWLLRERGNQVAVCSFDEAISSFSEVHRHYVAAGDARSAAQIGCYLGSFFTWSGGFERAADCIDEATLAARRLAAEYLQVWALYTRGKLMVEIGPSEQAAQMLDEVVAKTVRSPRMRAGALVYAGINALRAGRVEKAAALAELARSVSTGGGAAAAASALLARSQLARGLVAQAVSTCGAVTPSSNLVSEFDELIRLARAEVALAGDSPDADALVDEAQIVVRRRAETIADPMRRNAYLARPHLVVATLALTRRRGLHPAASANPPPAS